MSDDDKVRFNFLLPREYREKLERLAEADATEYDPPNMTKTIRRLIDEADAKMEKVQS